MISDYVRILRPSHWIKNAFMVPGVIIAAVLTRTPLAHFYPDLIAGFASVCLVSSANYVINEWLDAEHDQYHPVKKNRPVVARGLNGGLVALEYALVLAGGLGLAWFVSASFFWTAVWLAVMGFFYNVKPFRTKDVVYLDVLSESLNNAIRLLMGWFIVAETPLPPSTLVISYWMGGAYLMAVKRYSEYRFIGDPKTAGLYRRSFRGYSETRLLGSAFFYALTSGCLLGVFLIKYRVELIFSIPFIAILFAWYLGIGMRPNSPAQHPELLYKEKTFLIYCVLLGALILALFFLDVPWSHRLLDNAFSSQSS